MSQIDCDVLVVGAGPVGLVLAADLRRRGVNVRIVDRADRPAEHSRAIGVQSRTLELLEGLDLAEPLLARATRAYGVNVHGDGERIAHISFDDLDSSYRFLTLVPQSVSEECIARRFEQLGGTIERGLRVSGLHDDGDRVRVEAVHTKDGARSSIAARYVVGCDGAHSTVREQLGVPFEGEEYAEAFALADVDLEWDHSADEVHVFLSTDGTLAAFPMPGARAWRIVADLRAQADVQKTRTNVTAPTIEEVRRFVAMRAPMGGVVHALLWSSAYSIHRRIVPSYRRGRVFLAGDAAHVHSPIGGQGMNVGIQDALNLGFKLALVLGGHAPDGLLDSYHLERHPVGVATLAETDVATRMVTLRSPIVREIRDGLARVVSQFDVVQHRVARRTSMITVNYRRSPIVDEHRLPVGTLNFIADRSIELPSVKDWLDFGAGPAPGERVPDVRIDPTHDDSQRLAALLRGTGHTLLLFDGAASTFEGYRNLAAIGAEIRDRYGALFEVHVVVPTDSPPAGLEWNGSVVLDAHGVLHNSFGARSECLYVIRPDGYVGFRSQPADRERLLAWTASVFSK